MTLRVPNFNTYLSFKRIVSRRKSSTGSPLDGLTFIFVKLNLILFSEFIFIYKWHGGTVTCVSVYTEELKTTTKTVVVNLFRPHSALSFY